MVENKIKVDVYTHILKFPDWYGGFGGCLNEVQCEINKCVCPENFVDFSDCLNCEHMVLESISDQLLEELLEIYFQKSKHMESSHPISQMLLRLAEIKMSRKAKSAQFEV